VVVVVVVAAVVDVVVDVVVVDVVVVEDDVVDGVVAGTGAMEVDEVVSAVFVLPHAEMIRPNASPATPTREMPNYDSS